MSYYGQKTFRGLFSVSKQLLEANGTYRFGGAHAQVAYSIADGSAVEIGLSGETVNVIKAGASDVVSVALIGINPLAPAVFENLTISDVVSSVTLPAGTYGILLDGAVTVGTDNLDAAEGLHLLMPETLVNGNGKLLTFTFNQP